jgi:SSS family solute:Na+ symporter
MHASLFVYIQQLFTFFAPPFSAVFLLGSLWRRISGPAATVTVFAGFAMGIVVKLVVDAGGGPPWLSPYANQGIVNWAFCMVLCTALSLLGNRPRPDQITDDLTFRWHHVRGRGELGNHWYTSVVFWWALSFAGMIAFLVIFGGIL